MSYPVARWTALALLYSALPVHAHPVPKGTYDRKIAIHLQVNGDRGSVRIHYRLEVDELTIVLDELDRLRSLDFDIDVAAYRGEPLKFYAEFMRLYGPLIARRLEVRINDQDLSVACVGRTPFLHDENGQPLGHVRCDFTFRADFKPEPSNSLGFRDNNFEDKKGALEIRFAGLPLPRFAATCALLCAHPAVPSAGLLIACDSPGIRLFSTVEPAGRVNAVPDIERMPGADDQLRTASALFATTGNLSIASPQVIVTQAPSSPRPAVEHDDHNLLHLFLHSNYSIAFLLLIFAGIGAVHALTPGHGKTLVAAYLVGQRGTVWHALLLGIVTTLTHTGVVLVFAVALNFVPSEDLAHVQTGLGLAMGIAIACLGFWLLLKRLAGQADHVHIGGDHHHHDHHHHAHEVPTNVTWWGLIVLGMTGGIIPCWDAVAILFLCIGRGELWLALPLVLAFSAGLAGVLVLIGVLVVKMRNFASSRFGEGRLSRVLPIVSALVITAIGVWLCYASVHGGPA